MRLGRSGRRRIACGEVFVDVLADRPELTVLELADAEAAPAFGGADQRRIHQLQDGAFAEGMGDDFGAPPLLAKQALQQIGNWYEDRGARPSGWDRLGSGIWCDHPGRGAPGAR